MSISKKTVLVLASTFPRWSNDTEPRFVYDLCQLLKDDFKIIVLSPHCSGSEPYEVLDGLNVFRYRYGPEKFEGLAYEGGITAKLKKNRLNWFMLPFFLMGQWVAIIKLVHKYPVDVIHAHWMIPQGILALVARLVSKNKPAILCTSHGGDLYSLNDPISKAIKRYVIKNVDAVTVVSTAMQEEIKKIVPHSILPGVAPMGADLQHLFAPNNSIKRRSNQLLFVGRLVEKKGLKYLLKALPEVVKHNPRVILNIVGTGPEQKKLESLVDKLDIEEYVNFLGQLSHNQLVHQYRKAAIAVFPFIQAKNGDEEGLGLVTIEAQGCGCPVIVSSIPAVHDILTHDVTGVLTPQANSEKLAYNINQLLFFPDKRKKLAEQGRANVLKKFSWQVAANQYSSLIYKIYQ